MERTSRASVVAVAICLVIGMCSVAWAGVEPSPFEPEINKLKDVENELESVNRRLQDVLTTPPKKVASAPKGILDKLEEITHKLQEIDKHVGKILSTLPQDPAELPSEVDGGLRNVEQGLETIANLAKRGFSTQPTDRRIAAALEGIQGAAWTVFKRVVTYVYTGYQELQNRLVIVSMEAPEYVENLKTFPLLLSVSDRVGIQKVDVRFGTQEYVVEARGQTFAFLALDLSPRELGVFTLEAVAVGVDGVRGTPKQTLVTVGARPATSSALGMDSATLRRRIAEWKRQGLTPLELYERSPLYKKPKFKPDEWEILEQYPVPKQFLKKYGKAFFQQDWWRKWQQLGGGQPFDWKKQCGNLPGITPHGEVLRCWLEQNPAVAASLIWETVDLETGTVFPDSYFFWSEQMKEELDSDFYVTWVWLDSGLKTPMGGPPDPSINMIPPDAWDDRVALNPQQARVLYMATVAHSLALEIGGFVPWSVLDYSPEDLRVLFSSHAMFNAGKSTYLDGTMQTQDYTGYFLETVLHAFPQKTFPFFADEDIIRPSHYSTVTRLLGWSGEHLTHTGNIGGDTDGKSAMEVAYMHWQYYGQGPVARMLDGTVRENTDQIWSWTEGCTGTSHFYVSILRALNIPAYALYGCGENGEPFLYGHTSPLFPTIGQSLSHGDDVYHWDSFLEDVLPPPAYVSVAHLFISWETFLDWFYDHPKPTNVGRQKDEIRLEVLSNDVLDLYCDDLNMQFPPWESSVYSRFADYHSLTELENMDLWGRLSEKEQILDYCNVYWNW